MNQDSHRMQGVTLEQLLKPAFQHIAALSRQGGVTECLITEGSTTLEEAF